MSRRQYERYDDDFSEEEFEELPPRRNPRRRDDVDPREQRQPNRERREQRHYESYSDEFDEEVEAPRTRSRGGGQPPREEVYDDRRYSRREDRDRKPRREPDELEDDVTPGDDIDAGNRRSRRDRTAIPPRNDPRRGEVLERKPRGHYNEVDDLTNSSDEFEEKRNGRGRNRPKEHRPQPRQPRASTYNDNEYTGSDSLGAEESADDRYRRHSDRGLVVSPGRSRQAAQQRFGVPNVVGSPVYRSDDEQSDAEREMRTVTKELKRALLALRDTQRSTAELVAMAKERARIASRKEQVGGSLMTLHVVHHHDGKAPNLSDYEVIATRERVIDQTAPMIAAGTLRNSDIQYVHIGTDGTPQEPPREWRTRRNDKVPAANAEMQPNTEVVVTPAGDAAAAEVPSSLTPTSRVARPSGPALRPVGAMTTTMTTTTTRRADSPLGPSASVSQSAPQLVSATTHPTTKAAPPAGRVAPRW